MADAAPADLADDLMNQLLHEEVSGHDEQMLEITANSNTESTTASLTSVKKFDEVGPIESAAAEMIMRLKPKSG